MHLLVNGRRIKPSSLMRYPVRRKNEREGKFLSVVGFTVHNQELVSLVLLNNETKRRFSTSPSEVIFDH